MIRKLAISAAILLGLVSWLSTPAHAIVYDVNRTIGAGTVVGTITTDGTIGVLSNVNIVAFAFTLTAPNLLGGSPHNIPSSPPYYLSINGSGLTANASFLQFDSAQASWFRFNEFGSNGWCMVGNTAACFAPTGFQEGMFYKANFLLAQSAPLQGSNQIIGTAQNVSPVPIPAIFPIFAAVMGLFGFVGWRRRRAAATA